MKIDFTKVARQTNLLRRANLSGADLSDADLSGANLRSANLRSADLRSANLRSADLRSADLSGAGLPHFQLPPQEGEFIAWKSVLHGHEHTTLKLLIPADARRTSSLVGRKCRASRVKVLEALGTEAKEFTSQYAPTCTYRVGEVAEPDGYSDDIRVECAQGIHFFMTRAEADEFRM